MLKRGNETSVKEVALRNLGVSSTDEINAWFEKSYRGGYRIDGIDAALDLIDSRKWDRIIIVGDYDIDGCTATAQFRLVLKKLGYPVSDRIPKRFSEGFGLNPGIINEMPDGKILVITVDNGIAALDAVALAKRRGFSVIVTDHHQPVVENGTVLLPDADVIIDPNAIAGSADYNGYCGSGIAYKMLCALIDRKVTDTDAAKKFKAMLQPLAMMGTIGDVMELREENYVIARNGLARLDKRQCVPGLLELHDRLGIEHPTAADIGFKSGPCINANGRLYDEGAAMSVDLLASTDAAQAAALADRSVENNNLRKRQVDAGMLNARAQIAAEGLEKSFPLIVYLPGTNEGIIGIIAGRLREEFGAVAIVFTDSEEEGVLKGSGRSTNDVDLKGFLDEMPDLFVRYGGHEGAAGMSIKKADLPKLRKTAGAIAKKHGFSHEDVGETVYDLEITAEEISKTLYEVCKYGPFGQGNAPIVFKITGFRLLPGYDGKLITKIGDTSVKLNGQDASAIGFGLYDRMKGVTAPCVTLYGTLAYNHFRGKSTPQIEFTDFEEESVSVKQTPLMQKLLQQARA